MTLANDLVFQSTSTPKKKDGRTTNQHGVVFFMNDGTATTSEKLSQHYGIGRNLIQKAYRENNKDYLLANKAIEDLKANG